MLICLLIIINFIVGEHFKSTNKLVVENWLLAEMKVCSRSALVVYPIVENGGDEVGLNTSISKLVNQ